MSFESLLRDCDRQQLQMWWSNISRIDFEAIEEQQVYHKVKEVKHNNTNSNAECLPAGTTSVQYEPRPIETDGLVRVVDELPLEILAGDLCRDQNMNGLLNVFVDYMRNDDGYDGWDDGSACDFSDVDSMDSSSPKKPFKNRPYESINFRDNHGERWNRHFQDLQDFYAEHGHCIVPNNYQENPSLAQWVKRQRHQHKLKSKGKHSTLTRVRQEALERLGFVWSAQDAMWEERFKELEAFKESHGHCNVPSSHRENPKLSIWVKSQRRQCKLFRRNEPCFITEERFLKLKALGFDWNPRNL